MYSIRVAHLVGNIYALDAIFFQERKNLLLQVLLGLKKEFESPRGTNTVADSSLIYQNMHGPTAYV